MTDQSYLNDLEDEFSLSNIALVSLLQEVLSKDKPFRFRAFGTSMYPLIRHNDLVKITPLRDLAVKVGDAVAFINPETEKLTVHRIVRINQDVYLCQGDNTIVEKESIHLKDIIGKVTMVERNGKIVRFGLGPEKRLVAYLSHRQLLRPFFQAIVPFIRRFRSPLL